MSIITGQEICYAAVGATRLGACSFVGQLDSGELLTGTPTVAEETTSDLTLANKAVNTAELTLNQATVAIGQAVQFSVSGQLRANSPYTITITVGTDASPAQTLVGKVTLVAVP